MANIPVPNISQVLNGDNFKHYITIGDIVDGVKQILDLTDIDITVTYLTLNSVKTYVASKVGDVYTNCSLDSTLKKLKVVFDNYNLDNGVVHCRITIKIADSDYPDGFATFNRYICTGVELVSDTYFTDGI